MKILKALAAVFFLSGCLGATQSIATAADFGAETLRHINAYRSSRGLSPVSSHPLLEKLARQHSVYQASRNSMGHDGYRQRAARAKAAGLTLRCAENVGFRYRNAQHLFSGWKRSREHNVNLLRPNLRYAGVSIVGSYATFFACG